MNDQHEGGRSVDLRGVEAMLEAAGAYVDASDDLRPRVLETVRQHQKRSRQKQRAVIAAAGLLIVTLFAGLQAATLGDRLADNSTSERVAQLVESGSAAPYHSGIDELCWRLVDAVLTVRSEQAAALGPREASSDDGVSSSSEQIAAQNEAAVPSD